MKPYNILFLFLFICINHSFGQLLVPFKNHSGLWGYKHDVYRSIIIPPQYYLAYEFAEGLAGVGKVSPGFQLRFGFINETGREVIALKYLNVDQFSEGLAAFKASNNKVGYIDKTGKEVIAAKYDFANKFCNGLAAVVINKKCGYIDKTGKVVIPLIYETAFDFKADYAVVQINGRPVQIDKTGKELPLISEMGYLDRSTLNVIIPATDYQSGCGFTADGLAIIQSKNYLYGAINQNGNTVIPFKYNSITRLENGLYEVSSNRKFGIVDKFGIEKIAPQYDMIADYTPELVVANKGEEWIIIDKHGNITTPLLSSFYFFEGNLARVRIDRKWGVINQQGKLIFPINYQSISLRAGGLIVFQENNKWGLANINGEIYLPATYDQIDSYADGLAVIKKDKKFGFIGKDAKEIISPKYSRVEQFSEGLAKVELNKLFGFIDVKGIEIVPPKYTKASNFSEGLAAVAIDNKYGYIDYKGKLVLPIKYYDAKDFSDGLAAVGIFGQYGYINKTGKLVLPAIYDDANQFVNGLVGVKINGKWGFINTTGKIIIEPLYEGVKPFSEDKAGVKINGKWGFINIQGKEIVKPKYGEVEFFSEGMAAVNFASFGFRWIFIDTTGKEIGDGPFRAVSEYKNGKANVVDFNWREYYIDMKGKEIKPLKNKQAEEVFVVFKKPNSEGKSTTPTVNEKNKKLNETFSLVFYYKKNNSGVFEKNFSPRKFEVTRDYITEYISSNGYFTQWGDVKKIAASDTRTENNEILNYYQCTDGTSYGFYKGKNNFMLGIFNKNGGKDFYFTNLD